MIIDRRTFVAAAAAGLASPALGAAPARAGGSHFPAKFLWGAATAGHQIEGNNVNSDCWLLENVKPTLFSEPSGDADNSFELWPVDLDLARNMGLNAYRFSLEWARIEPEPGFFSIAMLDHYKRIIEGCRLHGMTPVVTFCHYTAPRWFAASGGWTRQDSPQLFATFCERAMRHLGAGIGYAATFNEPNIMNLLEVLLPAPAFQAMRGMLDAAAKASGTTKFVAGNAMYAEDIGPSTVNLIAAHKLARAAIKTIRPDLPVGVTLAMFDDEAVGPSSIRDAMRAKFYGAWLTAMPGNADFIGVQNYETRRWGANGPVEPPPGTDRGYMGAWVNPPSLANAVRYAHQATGLPTFVTEHGVGTDDDRIRQRLIPAALRDLKGAMDDGIPVIGYMHWSLIDNFEWISGYKTHFGLHSVDRTTFRRTPKPSAAVYSAIVRRNGLS